MSGEQQTGKYLLAIYLRLPAGFRVSKAARQLTHTLTTHSCQITLTCNFWSGKMKTCTCPHTPPFHVAKDHQS